MKDCEVPRTGYFDLVHDDDANTEVLVNEQIYQHLKECENMELPGNELKLDVRALGSRKKPISRKRKL